MSDTTAFFEPVWVVSLLPQTSTPWESAIEAVDADLVARDPVNLIAQARSDQDCPEPWLPYLAAERSVDEFSSLWPIERQRAVVAASFGFHQRKGTRRAIDNALKPFGYRVKVVEWFEAMAGRRPYTFRIRVTLDLDETWNRETRSLLIRLANVSKNAHTKLEAIELARDAPPAAIFVGGVTRRRRRIEVGQQPKVTNLEQRAHVFTGVFLSAVRRTTIRPRP